MPEPPQDRPFESPSPANPGVKRLPSAANPVQESPADQDSQSLRRQYDTLLEFVHHLVHELRTPLTSIAGFSDFLYKNGAQQPPDKLRHYCEILYLESSRLTRMVDGLLDLSRMRSKRFQLRKAPLKFSPLVQRCFQNLQFQAESKNIKLSASLPPELPVLFADADKIQQVLTNLIVNAIHYSPEGSEIQAGARIQTDQILCWVRDNGIGIAKENRHRVFDEFFRVNDDSTSVKGSGLGLPITRMIIELHQGRIWVESANQEGSTFFFTLPLDPLS